ncbi:heat shock factor protein 2 isoform X1 [Labrus mixtus]|uniref:heat shock factor protein 2 isoform X1 n=1 Tax=Labrus mixtus TaxID=508554 RepID=UPI0029BFDBCB|nr:heat shock factor protein 2 isoform X1 [Labrus mixtus]
MKHNSNVPAFLTKLWTLVEDENTNEFICWSQEGNSFLVLDEQHFAKEILPKFFKHNNMASFIRQLNMYGFRKVMHMDTGIVKQERDGPVEFQHPYFKHGQDDLLENIKRKVSNARPEDSKIRQEDLTKIIASVQSVHSKQENIDARLITLKRENEALWREISDLRQKHVHQQQLIKKLIHFIVTLVQNNHILNLKRKRPILMNSSGKKPKYIHEIFEDKVCADQSAVGSMSGGKAEASDDVIICDVTESDVEVTEESLQALDPGSDEMIIINIHSVVDEASVRPLTRCLTSSLREMEIVEVELYNGAEAELSAISSEDSGQTENGNKTGSTPDSNAPTTSTSHASAPPGTAPPSVAPTSSTSTSSALQLNKAASMSLEDPVKMMDSILNENGAISQNINLLGKLELMDYLDSIDCSLEDFQAMLYGKQFGIDVDALEESVSSKESLVELTRGRTEEDNTDKQLIQYTSCPLLAFLDGCTPTADLDLGSSNSSSTSHLQLSSSASLDSAPLSDLLESSLETKQSAHSSLIRLEPLTEAEASQETLFYMCELSPAAADTDSSHMDAL